MTISNVALRAALIAGTSLAVGMVVAPSLAADVTPERLINADKEPQNWLMNHRTYDGQRFSPLARINRDNVKNLKLAYAVPLGGGAGNEFTNATPLAEDGFLYVTDSWNVLYKIDVRSGDVGRIVWRMDPKQDRQMRSRGAALVGQPRHHRCRRFRQLAAHHRDRQGNRQGGVGDLVLRHAGRDLHGGAARHQGQDHRRRRQRRPGRARLDRRPRCRDRQAAVAQIYGSGAGRTGQRNLEGQHQCLATGGGAVWVTGTYDPATNQTLWGTGNPVPMFDPFYRPGDNLFTNSVIS